MTDVMNVMLDDEHGNPRPLQDGDLLDALAFSNDWERDWDGSECPDESSEYDGLTIVELPGITCSGTLFNPVY